MSNSSCRSSQSLQTLSSDYQQFYTELFVSIINKKWMMEALGRLDNDRIIFTILTFQIHYYQGFEY